MAAEDLSKLKEMANKAKDKVKDQIQKSMFKALTKQIKKLISEQKRANELLQECSDKLDKLED